MPHVHAPGVRLQLGTTKYRNPPTQAQRNFARKQAMSTSRLSQLPDRSRHTRHVNQHRRLQHDDRYASPEHPPAGSRTLPSIPGASSRYVTSSMAYGAGSPPKAVMQMSESVPTIARTRARRKRGTQGRQLTHAQMTARRRQRAMRIKNNLDTAVMEEKERRRNGGGNGSSPYRRRKLQRNLPSLTSMNGSPSVPALPLSNLQGGGASRARVPKHPQGGKKLAALSSGQQHVSFQASSSTQQASSSQFSHGEW